MSSKEAVHIFLDAWIFNDKLTGSVFTPDYAMFCIFHRQDFVFILCSGGLFKGAEYRYF